MFLSLPRLSLFFSIYIPPTFTTCYDEDQMRYQITPSVQQIPGDRMSLASLRVNVRSIGRGDGGFIVAIPGESIVSKGVQPLFSRANR